MSKIDIKTLENGLTIITEVMPGVKSAAFSFKIPSGAAYIDKDCSGAGSVISEWLFRGTQKLTSKELVDKLENLGLHRSSNINTAHINISGALESSNLLQALNLHSQVILSPKFDQDQFNLCRETAIAELKGLDDDPRQKVMLKLKEQFYPEPYSHNPIGTEETLKGLESDKTSQIYMENLDMSNTVFSVAGQINPETIYDHINKLFGSNENAKQKNLPQSDLPAASYRHIPNQGAQLHIGLMCPAVTMTDPQYYNMLVGSNVLGGGMSSRLFTEVREKRGLCYAIGARYQTIKTHAGIGCYAGTTPDKAQETLDVIVSEFKKLSQGITADEIERAKVGLKSSLVMSSESSSARSSNLGSDFYLLGKVRTLDEIKDNIEKTTVESVTGFLKDFTLGNFTICTIGPKEINPPSE